MALTEQQGKQACARIMKHEPAPWLRVKDRGLKFPTITNYVNSGDNARTLAIIYGETIEQADANAKLIVAAPSLLDALIAIVDAYRTTQFAMDVTALIDDAQSAIDKATK